VLNMGENVIVARLSSPLVHYRQLRTALIRVVATAVNTAALAIASIFIRYLLQQML